MKKLLLLIEPIPEKGHKLSEYLKKRLGSRIEVTTAKFSDLIFFVDGRKTRVVLKDRWITDFDLIYLRHADPPYFFLTGALAVCLEHFHLDYFDTAYGDLYQMGPKGDKLTSLIKLSLAGLPVPPSIFLWRDKIWEKRQMLVSALGIPLVAKEVTRHRGMAVYLIRDEKDFSLLEKTKKEYQFLFQRFYSEADEYRVVVLGYRPVIFYQKCQERKGEFRRNEAQGGRSIFLDLRRAPAEMLRAAVRAAKILELEVTGVDFLVTKRKEIWLLEANRTPGFTFDNDRTPELATFSKFIAKRLGCR